MDIEEISERTLAINNFLTPKFSEKIFPLGLSNLDAASIHSLLLFLTHHFCYKHCSSCSSMETETPICLPILKARKSGEALRQSTSLGTSSTHWRLSVGEREWSEAGSWSLLETLTPMVAPETWSRTCVDLCVCFAWFLLSLETLFCKTSFVLLLLLLNL